MFLGIIARAAAALHLTPPPPGIEAAIDHWCATLRPRALLLVGSSFAIGREGSLVTMYLDCPVAPKPSRRVRIWPEDPLAFLERSGLRTRTAPPLHSAPREGFFDLAVIDADRYPDPSTLKRLVHRLGRLAHRSSVVILASRRKGWLAPAANRLVAARPGLDRAGVALADGEIVFLADLPQAAVGAARGSRVGLATMRAAEPFVARHRQRPPPAADAGEPVPGAPLFASRIVMPAYREIGGSPRLGTDPAFYNRGLASWWGKPLETLPGHVSVARDVRLLRANGYNRAVLMDADGAVLGAGHRWLCGYGPGAASAAITGGASMLIDASGHRLPLSDGLMVPTERRVERPLMLLGFLDNLFGHALTEGLSRAWALEWALAQGHDVLAWWEEPAPPFLGAMIDLLGIPADRLERGRPGTLYEHLILPSEGFRLMNSVLPALGGAWRRMAEAAHGSGDPGPRDVFLSRRGQVRRQLLNLAELERHVADRGFTVVRPEDLAFADQVRLAHGADRIVGCFGSQLHLSMFMPPGARKLVIAREHFNGPEETLIALANDTEAAYYLEPQERRGFQKSRSEAWSIDMAAFAPAFDRWIAE